MLICKRCKSELLMVEYSDHNFFYFCGECGDKNSELEIYFGAKYRGEDVDFEFKEDMREW